MNLRFITLLPLATLMVGCLATEEGDDGDESVTDESSLVTSEYVAMGDSYSSGVGTREYYDSGCKRSNFSYPVKIANARGYPLQHVACSGARIPDVRNNQLGALSSATGLVTISIGGNDAGFSSVVTECAKPWPWTCWGKIDSAQSFIQNTLPGQLNSLYNDIRARAPNAHVVVVGYPRIFNGEECNFGARISSGEQTRLNDTANLLSNTVSAAAAAHGFDYVDPRAGFTSHAICDDVEWINGLSNPVEESYHPNRSGHDGYVSLITPKL